MSKNDEVDKAVEFCKENLTECCQEIIDWRNTGVLMNGKTRQLARLCSYAHHHALIAAERMVEIEAMKKIADKGAR